jgi:hypothetical protein
MMAPYCKPRHAPFRAFFFLVGGFGWPKPSSCGSERLCLDLLRRHGTSARWRYLAGETFTNADCAVIPYILRLEH